MPLKATLQVIEGRLSRTSEEGRASSLPSSASVRVSSSSEAIAGRLSSATFLEGEHLCILPLPRAA
ncbi:hypothetical protein QFC24_007064 [Naganishia onofrii]|uniref:Uncharacterized protein n=1 Tax=Naganishia onofrii TaxID=1851511 RepID=A0ACC2WUH1_9TREE|nr:hypothetical protein QFC24_007064 [Naganishia onofrii]